MKPQRMSIDDMRNRLLRGEYDSQSEFIADMASVCVYAGVGPARQSAFIIGKVRDVRSTKSDQLLELESLLELVKAGKA